MVLIMISLLKAHKSVNPYLFSNPIFSLYGLKFLEDFIVIFIFPLHGRVVRVCRGYLTDFAGEYADLKKY